MLCVESTELCDGPHAGTCRGCRLLKCHFGTSFITGLVFQRHPSVPLLPTTDPMLDCSGEGTKRTFHPVCRLRLIKLPSLVTYERAVSIQADLQIARISTKSQTRVHVVPLIHDLSQLPKYPSTVAGLPQVLDNEIGNLGRS